MPPVELAAELGIPGAKLMSMLVDRFFGAAWAEVEANSPFLVGRRVKSRNCPGRLPMRASCWKRTRCRTRSSHE